MTRSRTVLAALAFVVQLAGLASFAIWGWDTGHATVVRALLAVGTPLVGAVVWWAFCSRPARTELSTGVAVSVRVVLLTCAGLALLGIHQPGWALLVVFVAVVEAVACWELRPSEATSRHV